MPGPDPGSGVSFFWILDPGSLTRISVSLVTNFWMKNSSIGPQILFLFKNKIVYNFVKCMAIKKRFDNIFFPLLLFVIVGFGSGIRDPEWKNPDPGSRINILDPQHCE